MSSNVGADRYGIALWAQYLSMVCNEPSHGELHICLVWLVDDKEEEKKPGYPEWTD